MTHPRAKRTVVLGLAAAALFGAVSAVTPSADAGVFQSLDEQNLLTPADVSMLRTEALQWPFELRVLTTSRAPNRAAFDQLVRAQVTVPNVIVVGIDPSHRVTSVHFGIGTRISPAYYRQIEDAADPFFRGGNWRGGVEAIAMRAATVVGTMPGPVATPTVAPNYGYYPQRTYVPVAQAPRSSGFGYTLVGLLVLGGVVALIIAVARRASNGAGGYSSGGYVSNGYGPMPPGGPVGYGYGAPVQPGISPLGAGLVGAGLGAAAGYVAGQYAANHAHDGEYYPPPPPVYDPPPVYESAPVDSGPSYGGSYDAGGSTSGWDSGGGDSGGWSGGGGDSGGGGGDW